MGKKIHTEIISIRRMIQNYLLFKARRRKLFRRKERGDKYVLLSLIIFQ
jgi:hypothetical protein